jgi:AcrR family transcriptional regulator
VTETSIRPVEDNEPSATHRRLLDAAAALFRQKGYSAATTRELANAVGIQNASLYYHIRRKDDLLYQLCVESLERITQTVSAAVAVETEPGLRLHSLIQAHLVTSLADQDRHATMLTELRSLTESRRAEVVAMRDRYEALVRDVIQDGQDAGVLRTDISARHLTLGLLNMLNWTIFWFHPGGMSATEIASVFASIFTDGARAQRSPSERA